MKHLFELLAKYGGTIISSNDLHPDLIAQARASNRMYVDENFLGYVWEPPFAWRLPVTEEEIEMFDWCYPIHPELPESLKSADFLFKKNKKKKLPFPDALFEPEFTDLDYSKTVYGMCRHGNNMANCNKCQDILMMAIFSHKKIK